MELLHFKWLIDFGLVILIAIVQWIVYPSFTFYRTDSLRAWHTLYTKRIFFIVFPLMISQLALSVFMVMRQTSWYAMGSLSGAVALFLLTFIIFVPVHNKISAGLADQGLLTILVQRNWWRTILWFLLFLWTSFELLA